MRLKHIEIAPIGKPRMTRADRWTDKRTGRGRPAVLRYFAWKDEIRQKLPGYIVPDSLDVVFEIAMPNSWSGKKRREMAGRPHQQRPDIDNLVKALLDTFCKEDAHVWRVCASKRWAYTSSITIIER